MYPLQLFPGNVTPAAFMEMTTAAQLQAVEGITTTPKASSTVPGTPVAPSGGKHWWQSPEQNLPTQRFYQWKGEASEEHPHKRLKPWKEGRWEAFSKESSLVRAARWTYQDSHPIDFRQEGSHNLSSVFCKMASSAHLPDSSIFEVQDTWCGWKDLKAANQVAKISHKCIYFFRLILPMESPKIMGIQDIHPLIPSAIMPQMPCVIMAKAARTWQVVMQKRMMRMKNMTRMVKMIPHQTRLPTPFMFCVVQVAPVAHTLCLKGSSTHACHAK